MNEMTTYCSHCDEPTFINRMYFYKELPFDTYNSAKGDCGSLCVLCQRELAGWVSPRDLVQPN